MNKKKIIIISVPIIILLVGIYLLYNTFAISSYVSDNSDTYTINLTNGNNTIDVPSKSSKIVYYKINNTNSGTVKYGIGYNSSNIIVKVYEDSKDPVTGLVSSKDNKFVKLKLINNSTSNDTVTLSTIFGYENGGDLIVPSGVTLVTQKIKKVNTIKNAESNVSDTSNFLGTTLVRNTIESITITNDNIVPTNAIGSFDVSNSNDGSIMLWYTKGSSDNLYNVYIGSESGKVYAPINCYMYFSNLTNAIKIDLSYFDTSNTTYMAALFKKSQSVISLDLSMFNTRKVTAIGQLFNGCTKLTSVNLSSFNTSNVTNMMYMFNDCNSLEKIDLSNFDTSKVTDMKYMFSNCTSLKSLDLSNFNTSKVTNMQNLFRYCTSLVGLNISNFNTSKVTEMSGMFRHCESLTELDLSMFDTSNVTSMGSMFTNCTKLASVNLSSFDTSNVKDMKYMFNDCTSLEKIDLSNFDTSNVTSMDGMFVKCNALKELDLSNFNTSKVTTMLNMFQYCTSLTKLNISGFDTSNVTNMSGIFSYDSKLTLIDMRNMTFGSKLTDANSMFYNASKNATIYVKSNTEKQWLNTNYSNLSNIIVTS